MTPFSTKPETNSDDGHVFQDLDLINDYVLVGDFSGFTIHAFVRFAAPGLSQGVTIDSATLTLKGADNYSPTGTFKVVGCDEDNSTQITSQADFLSRARTTAESVITPPGTIVSGTVVECDVKNVVQEIVDRPGYTGGPIQLFLIQVDLGSGINIHFKSHEDGASDEPVLAGNYSTPGPAASGRDGMSGMSGMSGMICP